MMKKFSALLLGAAMTALPLAASAFAVYDNQTDFENAVAAINPALDGATVDESFGGSISSGSVVSGSGVVGSALFNVAGQPSEASQFTTLTFSAGGLRAFGASVGNFLSGEVVDILVNGVSISYSLSGPVSFFGIIGSPSDAEITSLTFDDVLGGATADAAFNLNNIRLVTSAEVAAVPLPAGGVLLLTALGAAGLVRRRKA